MYEDLKEQFKEIPLGRAKDISKQKFFKLQPLYRTNPPKGSKGTYWVCKCDCGHIGIHDASSLTTQRAKSCGCLAKENTQKQQQSKIGTKIGHWTILEGDKEKNKKDLKHKYWICQCDCENHTIQSVRSDALKTTSCKKCGTNKLVDLTGQKFGHWIVLDRGKNKGDGHTYWKCQCDCNFKTIRDVDAFKLKRGISLSCGCDSISKGEKIIKMILDSHNIPYETERIFPSCKLSEKGTARFDFYVNNQYLIEYDGEQHFVLRDSGWNSPEKLAKTQERDAIKNQWCKDNNIPLIRIPYTHLNDLCLEDLLLETSNFIL